LSLRRQGREKSGSKSLRAKRFEPVFAPKLPKVDFKDPNLAPVPERGRKLVKLASLIRQARDFSESCVSIAEIRQFQRGAPALPVSLQPAPWLPGIESPYQKASRTKSPDREQIASAAIPDRRTLSVEPGLSEEKLRCFGREGPGRLLFFIRPAPTSGGKRDFHSEIVCAGIRRRLDTSATVSPAASIPIARVIVFTE